MRVQIKVIEIPALAVLTDHELLCRIFVLDLRRELTLQPEHSGL